MLINKESRNSVAIDEEHPSLGMLANWINKTKNGIQMSQNFVERNVICHQY